MEYIQSELEIKFSKKLCFTTLKEAVRSRLDKELLNWSLGAAVQLEEYLKGDYYQSKMLRMQELKAFLDKRDSHEFLSHILATVIQDGEDQTIQRVVGHLAPYLPHDTEYKNLTTAGELIAIMGRPGNLYQIVRNPPSILNEIEQPIVQVNYWTYLFKLFETEIEWCANTHSNPPLIEPPLEVTDNFDAGYHVVNEPVVLGRFTDSHDQQALDVVNRLNSIPWKLDQEVKNIGERSAAPLTDMQSIKNFEKHKVQSERLYKILGDRPLWMIWQYDSRGRIYSHGYHVQFQSYEYKKALLNFDYYEKVTT